jgi:phage terminase small subunit
MTEKGEPLKNPRHEAFAQARSLGKPAAECYRIAGYRSKDSNVKGSKMAAYGNITARIDAIKAEANRKSALTKDRALEIMADIAERGEKDSDRIAACKAAGTWCGWETGTQAEQKAVSAQMAEIRSRKAGKR